MIGEEITNKNEKTKDIEFFWEIIDKKPDKNLRIVTDPEELKILEKNKIIELSTDRWLTHKDNLLHYFNVKKKALLSPGHFDLMAYDVCFGELIGKEVAYRLIKNEIFYICYQPIYEKDEINDVDHIIRELKNGTYGKIDKSKFWFVEIYPYIVSNTFFLRDNVAIEKAKSRSKEYEYNYGGRCVSLLSIKRVLIDNVPIQESTIDFEEKRLATTNLKIIMEKTKYLSISACQKIMVKKLLTMHGVENLENILGFQKWNYIFETNVRK